MKAFRSLLAVLTMAVGASVVVAEPMGPDIVVLVEGSKTTDGNIMVAVYASEETFLKEPFLARKAKPDASGRTEIIFKREELPEEFAISLYHDVNDSGGMETGFMRIPKEPFGFSNNPGFRMGPPLYAPSVLKRDEIEREIVIHLR